MPPPWLAVQHYMPPPYLAVQHNMRLYGLLPAAMLSK